MHEETVEVCALFLATPLLISSVEMFVFLQGGTEDHNYQHCCITIHIESGPEYHDPIEPGQ